MPVKNRIADWLPELTEIRRDFHRHPELRFDTHRTAARVAELLRSYGCDEVVEGIGRTGVVGVIRGREAGEGRAIGLRADMDALPIHEATGAEHASTVAGAMHACGHDGHTTMLLGAAKYLCETRNFAGSAVVIFQPAEEEGGGGLEMCKDGLMARFGINEVYGMHNMPGIQLGHFGVRAGAIMAAADMFDITVTGKGGHAAKPNSCIDTTLVAAHIIVALQSIVARNVDPLGQAVLSVCALTSHSTAHNVIPQNVHMRGTVRSMDAEIRELIIERMHKVVELTAEAYGASAVLDYQRGYPVTINSPEHALYAQAVAENIVGAQRVDGDTPPLMAAEDFSYMLEERPGAYLFLGNGDSAAVHHPAYDFNDEAIPFGASWYAGMVEARLPIA